MIDAARALREAARGMPQTRVMEVCGTHTFSAARYALKQLLPENMELISGPGCPVCVTDGADIAAAMQLARRPDTVLFSFGDMLRVPASSGGSLLDMRRLGADVRIALSPTDALEAARKAPQKQIVWFAVGFETTAPLTAAMLLRARALGVKNLSVLCAHKTMPAALKKLLHGNTRVQALLCPGHVAVITGADAFRFVPEELALPGAVSGFEPEEMLAALTEIAKVRLDGQARLINCYTAAVTNGGNPTAQRMLETVFSPCSAHWRGLGSIPLSGLELSDSFKDFDARQRFELPDAAPASEPKGCICSAILRGEAVSTDCPLFGTACAPDKPVGPCMVSSEGACAAVYRYGG